VSQFTGFRQRLSVFVANTLARDATVECIDVKKRFYVFILVTFLKCFLISKRFLFLKNVGKVQSSKLINKKHFQNNSNEIDL